MRRGPGLLDFKENVLPRAGKVKEQRAKCGFIDKLLALLEQVVILLHFLYFVAFCENTNKLFLLFIQKSDQLLIALLDAVLCVDEAKHAVKELRVFEVDIHQRIPFFRLLLRSLRIPVSHRIHEVVVHDAVKVQVPGFARII